MSYQVVVTTRARADAIEAFAWLAEHSPEAAERWYLGLRAAIEGLGNTPEQYPVAEEESELLGYKLRQMLYGKRRGMYRLLFSVEGEVVTLHYVRHSARRAIEP